MFLAEISISKEYLVEVNWYVDISSNDEAAKKINLFALHLLHASFNKTWNCTVINWHIVTLFANAIYMFVPIGTKSTET